MSRFRRYQSVIALYADIRAVGGHCLNVYQTYRIGFNSLHIQSDCPRMTGGPDRQRRLIVHAVDGPLRCGSAPQFIDPQFNAVGVIIIRPVVPGTQSDDGTFPDHHGQAEIVIFCAVPLAALLYLTGQKVCPCAFGQIVLLSSHSRLHGSTSYRVPWVYDEEAVDVCRFFTRQKARLMPYLYETSIYTNRTGIPTMRSMVLEYTSDRNCSYLDKQYMLGDSLLVAPIFNEEGIGEYYLPEGTWTDFLTGEIQEGGKWYSASCAQKPKPLISRLRPPLRLSSMDS